MRLSARMLVFVTIALFGMCRAAAAAEAVAGAVRGAVQDDSGGVLPGVTVEASSADGRVLATAVTDEAGRYTFSALPAGAVRITFQLEGFAPAAGTVAVEKDAEVRLDGRLAVAPVAETIVVVGRAPVDPPPPPALPPLPAVIPIPIHDRDSVCGPAKPAADSGSLGTIRSHRYEGDRQLFTKDDQLSIDGGTETGLEIGQNLVVRRYYQAAAGQRTPMRGEHTAGLLQIVAAGERESTAVVVYACDELRAGDFLAAFNPGPPRMPDAGGLPAFDEAARILFADAGQMLGVPRRLMVIDSGSEAGIHVGQRLTLFRTGSDRSARGSRKPSQTATRSIVGNAVVVAVRTDSATIRVERVTDAIAFGDWAAPEHSMGGDAAAAAASLSRPR